MENAQLSYFFVFLAGIASFLSPCVLPLIPGYLSYISGITLQEREKGTFSKRKVLITSLGFVFGFSLIFIIMGASASALGQIFTEYRLWFQRISGVIIIVFGLHLSGALTLKTLYVERHLNVTPKEKGILSSVLMGIAFAAGWTPCVGPILATVLLYAGASDTVATGTLLLATYSLGLGIPFILTALAISSFERFYTSFRKYLHWISTISGGILVLLGILILTNQLAKLAVYFNSFDYLKFY